MGELDYGFGPGFISAGGFLRGDFKTGAVGSNLDSVSFLRDAAYFISEGLGSTAFLIGELFISKADGLGYMAF